MRRIRTSSLILILVLALTGTIITSCSSNAPDAPDAPAAPAAPGALTDSGDSSDTADNTSSQPGFDESLPAPEKEVHRAKEVSFGEGGIKEDGIIDLSGLSNLMAYAEVYNMVIGPEPYLGKTVKVKGTYFAEYYGYTQRYHHYIVVEDEAACCKQGLEFMWEGSPEYPDDFPPNGSTIEITGVFGQYDEQGSQVGCLKVKEITALD